uniref:Thioredoxin domain-containing protein n=1 Tax=Chrysotila carterae TaxID=13221 RepID=A0A7S4F352_CHRCT|mmetsp:Transcript_19337/g.41770  ORF Transcript_19337/g.41770 Transcript_19337/m.41770 type:complete len:252 (-) Transcript_19337:87-842(-)
MASLQYCEVHGEYGAASSGNKMLRSSWLLTAALLCAHLSATAAQLPDADEETINELAFGASVVQLDEKNFEHLTQAATGATSGDWLVKFCKPSVPRCARVDQAWSKVAVQLAASREALGLPRINVAAVDTSDSPWLTKRFSITSVPLVILFKSGVMYWFQGGGFSVERLMQFAERDYERSSRMLVPPEPHVATPHDQTFLVTICTVGAGAAVLWIVDQLLLRYYQYKKNKAKAAAKAARKQCKPAPAVEGK